VLTLALGAFLIASAGVVPIGASSGHWPVTRWLLDYAKARSVKTHSLGIASPPFDDPAMTLRGASHYESGCRPCHGAPGEPIPEVARRMAPSPPDLRQRVLRWEPEELFYVVANGIKFTGMPAWPARGRPDEVWAMVAFLLALPDLNAVEYRELALGETRDVSPPLPELAALGDPPEPVVRSCARCHGRDGMGRGDAFPTLAGQSPSYLAGALEDYASGRRASGIMRPIAAALEPADALRLADWYGRRMATRPGALAHGPVAFQPAEPARGRAIAHQGLPERKVPSCVDCHGPGAGPRNPAYPALTGQHASYLELQLRLFRSGHRGGSELAAIMHEVVRGLDDADLAAVARYYGAPEG
jgi:cytochrome c553